MGAVSDSRYTVTASWDDVPHIDAQTKKELLDGTPPHLRDARSRGIPSLGSGAIYPVALEDITVPPFQIPAWWRRCYGMDVGWSRTAAVWLAEDPEDFTIYAYAEYYRGEQLPLIHAAAIKARGEWLTGAIDPASRGRGQDDGNRLFAQYQSAGLNLTLAKNGVESGIYEVWSRLETGRLRFFSTLQNLAAEYRLYHRDEKGRVVKKNDHALDSMRYGIATFDKAAKRKPVEQHDTGITRRAADSKAGY